MVKPLFDTCILIDYLNGIDEAAQEFSRYPGRSISIITWMEVLVGAQPGQDAVLRAWLHSFNIISLDDDIAGHAVALRRGKRIRLPDAIIHATAQVHSLLLVTRNTKDFSMNAPGIRVPYQLPVP
jgi:predicted nucleic acid-binding protein